MAYPDFVLVFSKLVLGATATFLAIMVWSRTREAAWVLVVSAVIASYAGIVYSALKLFGIVSEDPLIVADIPIVELVIQSLPMLLFLAAFVVFLLTRRVR